MYAKPEPKLKSINNQQLQQPTTMTGTIRNQDSRPCFARVNPEKESKRRRRGVGTDCEEWVVRISAGRRGIDYLHGRHQATFHKCEGDNVVGLNQEASVVTGGVIGARPVLARWQLKTRVLYTNSCTRMKSASKGGQTDSAVW